MFIVIRDRYIILYNLINDGTLKNYGVLFGFFFILELVRITMTSKDIVKAIGADVKSK